MPDPPGHRSAVTLEPRAALLDQDRDERRVRFMLEPGDYHPRRQSGHGAELTGRRDPALRPGGKGKQRPKGKGKKGKGKGKKK